MSVVISFFFSSRRRHTRLQGDWSSGRVLFRSRHRFSAARLPPDRKPILFGPGKILKDLEARGGTLTVCDVAIDQEYGEEDKEDHGELHRWLTHPQAAFVSSLRD